MQKETMKVFPDVSVLLAGTLVRGSPSEESLFTSSNILLSKHVEEMCRKVLNWNRPGLLGDFNDGLLRLSKKSNLRRSPSYPVATLPDCAKSLSPEDLQVVSDAIGNQADVLLTHDSNILRLGPDLPSVFIQTPSYFASRDVECKPHPEHWTFLGIFYAHGWHSNSFPGTKFWILELSDFLRCYFEFGTANLTLEWKTAVGVVGQMSLEMDIEPVN